MELSTKAMKPFIAKIKARGQLTIPKKIQEMMHLKKGQAVSLIPLGGCVLMAPQRLELDEARLRISRILIETRVKVDDLMGGQVQEREALYREQYGKKAHFSIRYDLEPV